MTDNQLDPTTEEMKRFISERLDRIFKLDDLPFEIDKGPKVVLHILPIASFASQSIPKIFDSPQLYDLSLMRIKPLTHDSNNDAFLAHSSIDTSSYCQLFRTGCIESVESDIIYKEKEEIFIPYSAFKNIIIDAVLKYVTFLKKINMQCPMIVVITLLDVKGVLLKIDNNYTETPKPIDKDMLMFQDILIDDYSTVLEKTELEKLLTPTFDTLWNACGLPRRDHL